MRIGLAADHGGFALKQTLLDELAGSGHDLVDFGATELDPEDDYPDFVAPLARAVASDEVDRGIVICGSGVGACVAANKVAGVRAALITEVFSARQGVEDDDMNVICLGGRVIGPALALELVRAFLAAEYLALPRFERRLDRVRQMETGSDTDE
ncbi:MAG: RpiB/LacA/LacB family sugar-phosphate isomerase [Armatimonadia bacterium]|nr:RpiB/LacA/LacB family sugar-phosphate isomerase [Armatimonadia bacterium]